MSNKENEFVSAFMDGELDEINDGFINSLSDNESVTATWWRYHIISDALRAEKTAIAHKSLSERISSEIAKEPVVFAPSALKSVDRGFSWQKSLIGAAIAASVAMLAILGVQQGSNSLDTVPSDVQSVVQNRVYEPSPGQIPAIAPQNVNGQSIIAPALITPASSSRLNSYMVNYNEFRTSGTKMQGMLPYVRIIANDVNEEQK